MQAYCFKCRKKVEIKNAERVTLKNGRPATKGLCPTCGTKVFRIGQGQLLADFTDAPHQAAVLAK